MDIIVGNFVNPFGDELKRGRIRNLKHHSKKAGVYFIKEDGVIVYVGMSQSCVVEALYRHFYPWRDCYRGRGREYRTTYFDKLETRHYQVCIIEATEKQTLDLEKAMIIALNPRDNREKYQYHIDAIVQSALNGESYFSNNQSETDQDDLPF